MFMARKNDDLRKIPDDELKKERDKVSEHTVVGLNYFDKEIMRREQNRFNRYHILLSIFSLIIAIVAIVVALIK